MNYYEHHIGDYAEATSHLSFVEDAAYSRMIRKYYATEKPLPKDQKAVQRLIGARTKEEREAVSTVLDEFFTLQEDGWHNSRCDEEIARYQDKQSKAKRSAEARWNKSKPHSEGNANASPNAMRTHSEGNAHQAPDTSINNHRAAGNSERSNAPPSLQEKISTILQGHGVNISAEHPRIREWIDAGCTPAQADEAGRIAKDRKPEGNIPPNYLAPIIEEVMSQRKKSGQQSASRWWATEESTLEKGKEFGLSPGIGETWDSFRRRIQVAIDRQQKSGDGV